MIPITILTGFLGSGKTTLLNKIISQNPDQKFALIINEFGEIGIDGQIINNYNEEIIEISDGCICCVVQTDLHKTIQNILEKRKDVTYIIIETSGLAEPVPIINSVLTVPDPRLQVDSILVVVDCQNYDQLSDEYETVNEQIKAGDIVLLNKTEDLEQDKIDEINQKIKSLNPHATILENRENTPASLFIENGKWDTEKLLNTKQEPEKSHHNHNEEHKHDHDHHHHCEGESCEHHSHKHHNHGHHEHEHNKVDEVVFKLEENQILSAEKLDYWLHNKLPKNVIRAKGILQIHTQIGNKNFVFQMVGANKSLVPMEKITNKKPKSTCMVLIGKDLDKKQIISDLKETIL